MSFIAKNVYNNKFTAIFSRLNTFQCQRDSMKCNNNNKIRKCAQDTRDINFWAVKIKVYFHLINNIKSQQYKLIII